MDTVGKRIREARRRLDITQQQMTERLQQAGVKIKNRQAYQAWEADANPVSIADMEILAKTIGACPCWLAFGIRCNSNS